MKTVNSQYFFKFKVQPLCVLKSLFSGSLLQLPLSQLSRDWFKQVFHSVILGCRAGVSSAKVAYNEILSNNRVFVGFVMLVGVAPLYWAHLFFINEDLIKEGIVSPVAFIADPVNKAWFYRQWFYWFFTNREEFALILFLTGGFLLCKTDIKWGWKYAVVPVIAVNLCEVIYQTVYISHWSHFYRSLFSYERGWELFAGVVAFLYAGYKISDYLIYRKYHTKDGNVARLIGIVKTPGLPAEKKMDILEHLVKESENYNAI